MLSSSEKYFGQVRFKLRETQRASSFSAAGLAHELQFRWVMSRMRSNDIKSNMFLGGFNQFQPFSTRVNSHEELDLGLPKNGSSNGLSLRKDLEIDPLTAISMRTQSPKNNNESRTMSSRLRWSCSCRSFCRTLAALPRWTIRQHSTLRHGLSDSLGDNDGYWEMTSAEWWVWVPRSI